ncbi:nucleoside triphosphate hydrolase [Acetobacter sp. AN02]|uniref:nucleoside triphosphate hydrolase n=1 Tax=Acetobacter sp. AN02 TaxID=2894186 RepID=UPI0024345113|nr:nucleoside triphosphate hydrolase [Acetobacter sp. AN02]MDG6094846.1 nucleoside triphosphate hydrolase [Acetobacter sp. AN02]
MTSAPRHTLPGVIAIVGSDGAGKSTLAAGLTDALSQERTTIFMYLGQDSGNILKAILRIPLIGSALGRFLKKRSGRAHAEEKKPAAPDALTATVIFLLSVWRWVKFRKMLRLSRSGTLIITDRYPQAEIQGFYFDGPGLSRTAATSAFTRALATLEARLYERMSRFIPALVIRINVSAELAYARKPDHRLSSLQDKTRLIPALTFNGAHILDLDGSEPLSDVLKDALAGVRTALKQGPDHTS